MKQADAAMKKLTRNQIILMTLPLLLFLAPISGGVVGIYMESWVAFWVVAVAIIVLVPWGATKMVIAKGNKAYQQNWDTVTGSLESPDYAMTEIIGGIGIDIDNKKLVF